MKRRSIVKVPGKTRLLLAFSVAAIAIVFSWSSWYASRKYGDPIVPSITAGMIALIAGGYFVVVLRQRLKLITVRRYLKRYRQNTTMLPTETKHIEKIGPVCLEELFRSRQAKNLQNLFVQGNKDGAYAEFQYDDIRKTKYGEYVANTYFLSVYTVRLPRQLPLMLFDSHAAWRRQYKAVYDKKHIYSFEGDFSTYFDAYIPHYYEIDVLSIITPEVMEAIMAARDYDIEISGDNLYLIAPLEALPEQEAEMASLANGIKAKLMNNITTYRDERIAYADGRTQVGTLGTVLYKNLTFHWVSVCIGIAGIIAGIAMVINGELDGVEVVAFFAIQGAVGAQVIVTEKRRRRSDLFLYKAIEQHKKRNNSQQRPL